MKRSTDSNVPTNAELANLIVGKWKTSVVSPEHQNSGGGTTEYKADGTFVSKGHLLVQGELLEVDVEGVWSVEDRFLAWTATKSSIPDLIKCGEMITEEIFEIDSKHIRYGNAEEDAEVGIREA